MNDSNHTRDRREKSGLFCHYKKLKLLVKWHNVIWKQTQISNKCVLQTQGQPRKKVLKRSITDMLKRKNKNNIKYSIEIIKPAHLRVLWGPTIYHKHSCLIPLLWYTRSLPSLVFLYCTSFQSIFTAVISLDSNNSVKEKRQLRETWESFWSPFYRCTNRVPGRSDYSPSE